MTRQETIEGLKALLDCNYIGSLSGEDIESLESAISTMRKYQQIVNIVSLNDEEFKQCGLKELKEILEVIADGNDD